jgi:tyrosyl-tRNA synthetase
LGTDGSMKMSKSLGNYIAIDEPPNEIYGKVMSIPDELMMDYLELLTDVDDEELRQFREELDAQSVNPMVLKKRLARDIVAQFHDKQAAKKADQHFEKVVQKAEVPEEIPEHRLSSIAFGAPIPLKVFESVLVEAELVKSRGDAKRLLTQRAIEIDGKRVTSDMVTISDGSIIKVGKRRFVRIVNADKRA